MRQCTSRAYVDIHPKGGTDAALLGVVQGALEIVDSGEACAISVVVVLRSGIVLRKCAALSSEPLALPLIESLTKSAV